MFLTAVKSSIVFSTSYIYSIISTHEEEIIMKKWLSRGIVLAMVMALMIPAPVLAKSGKGGGKLVKSVTYYEPEDGGGWHIEGKKSFTYGKKNTPSTVTDTGYTTYLGIPVAGESQTYNIKYKGKKATIYDSAGFVSAKETYKGRNLVSWSSDSKSSHKEQKDDGTWYDWASFSASVGNATYFKNGLMKSQNVTRTGLNSDNDSYAYTDSSVYAWTQKKGVPSMMYCTSVWNGKNEDGRTGDGTPGTNYAIFNAKGFVVESGYVWEGKNYPTMAFTYTMKKGKVDTVVAYFVDDETGQPTPTGMMKFKYTKKSISKAYNLRMINSLVGCDGFKWFED